MVKGRSRRRNGQGARETEAMLHAVRDGVALLAESLQRGRERDDRVWM